MVLQDQRLYTFAKEKHYDKATEDIDLSNYKDCIESNKGDQTGFQLIGKTKAFPNFSFTSLNKQENTKWTMYLSSEIIVANNKQNKNIESKENKENIEMDVSVETKKSKESKENEITTDNTNKYNKYDEHEIFEFIATESGELSWKIGQELTEKERGILHQISTESMLTFSQFSTSGGTWSISHLADLMVQDEAKKIIYSHLQTEHISSLWFSKLVTRGLESAQVGWSFWNDHYDGERLEPHFALTSLGFEKTYDQLRQSITMILRRIEQKKEQKKHKDDNVILDAAVREVIVFMGHLLDAAHTIFDGFGELKFKLGITSKVSVDNSQNKDTIPEYITTEIDSICFDCARDNYAITNSRRNGNEVSMVIVLLTEQVKERVRARMAQRKNLFVFDIK